MPFTAETTFPERPPDVQVFFHGLLMLIPESDGSECRVGVHRLSVDHKLSVDVRIKDAEPPDPPLLRLRGPLDSTGLTIKVFPETEDGVRKFVKDENEFDRAAPSNHEKDFRWCVDLQTLEPGLPPLELDNTGISPLITVADGLFYTARLTDPSILRVQLNRPGGPELLHRVARIIGANIYLEQDQKVILDWFAEGQNQVLELPKIEGDRTAVIYIDNSPLLMTGDTTHSEFVEYFKVITNVENQFDVEFQRIGPAGAGTDLAPCMSVPVGG